LFLFFFFFTLSVADDRYFHRSLNPQKLVDAKFSRLPKDMRMKDLIRKYKLDPAVATENLGPLTPADVPAAMALLNGYLKKYLSFLSNNNNNNNNKKKSFPDSLPLLLA
jgi:hypothetical protein